MRTTISDHRLAVCGAIVARQRVNLFLTPRAALSRADEPAVDDLKRDFVRFQKTFEKVWDLANDSLRVFNEFNNARARPSHRYHVALTTTG